MLDYLARASLYGIHILPIFILQQMQFVWETWASVSNSFCFSYRKQYLYVECS